MAKSYQLYSTILEEKNGSWKLLFEALPWSLYLWITPKGQVLNFQWEKSDRHLFYGYNKGPIQWGEVQEPCASWRRDNLMSRAFWPSKEGKCEMPYFPHHVLFGDVLQNLWNALKQKSFSDLFFSPRQLLKLKQMIDRGARLAIRS